MSTTIETLSFHLPSVSIATLKLPIYLLCVSIESQVSFQLKKETQRLLFTISSLDFYKAQNARRTSVARDEFFCAEKQFGLQYFPCFHHNACRTQYKEVNLPLNEMSTQDVRTYVYPGSFLPNKDGGFVYIGTSAFVGRIKA